MTAPRRRRRFVISTLLVSPVVLALLGEVAARLAGLEPWRPAWGAVQTTVEPAGQNRAGSDPVLGWVNLPSAVTMTLPDGSRKQITHGPDGLRIARPLDAAPLPADAPTIAIFGCSYSYGLHLDDRETFAWLLQERFPAARVRNFGVNGYGTLQSLLQLRREIEAGRLRAPAVAILAYATFHDERSAMLRIWRKQLYARRKTGDDLPRARLAQGGDAVEITLGTPAWRPPPLVGRSAVVNALDGLYNRIERRGARAHEVGLLLIRDFAAACRLAGIEPVIAGISCEPFTAAALALARARFGVRTVGAGSPLRRPGMSLAPFDPLHPSPAANREIADRLEACLRGLASSPVRK